MTDAHQTSADAQARSTLPLLVAILALVIAGAALWASYGSAAKPVPQAAVPQDSAIGQIKETLASVQQAVQGIQSDQQKLAAQLSDQQKLAAQLNDIQQKASAQQGEQKLISDQLGALSARVNSLESARAESPAAAPQAAPDAPRAKRTKR
ncbi:hypothetical protein [Bradyrhizobium sp. 33ap4]|uniref:hypothetical protein n=1 Tax=Bradyrhizobium sp. 33ap4 TaxID=3061630 RepID=UPI00292D0CC8|nr:hypothetical protein [Bradyrhizobium sp. 33ap4]